MSFQVDNLDEIVADLKADVATIKTWVLAHILISIAIGVGVGLVLGKIL